MAGVPSPIQLHNAKMKQLSKSYVEDIVKEIRIMLESSFPSNWKPGDPVSIQIHIPFSHMRTDCDMEVALNLYRSLGWKVVVPTHDGEPLYNEKVTFTHD